MYLFYSNEYLVYVEKIKYLYHLLTKSLHLIKSIKYIQHFCNVDLHTICIFLNYLFI